MKTLLIVIVSLIAFQADLVYAQCATTGPTIWANGNAVDNNGLCTALSTGEAALTLTHIDDNTVAIQTNTATIADTQNQSLLKQIDQYAQQVEEVQNLVIQTQMMIKDLEEQPLQVIVPDANQLIANQKRIDQLAQDIANNSSSIGANLIKDLQNPNTIGLGYGSKFELWSQARAAAAQESYTKVTQFIADASNRNKTITQAIYNIDHAVDKTATLKAMANAQGQQLTWLESIAETLNQLLGAQAVENGARQSQEMTNAQAVSDLRNNPIGNQIQLPKDGYNGPAGYDGSKGF